MTEIAITIPGDPVAKGRPRMTKSGRAYTPVKTRQYENYVRACAAQSMIGHKPLTGPLTARVAALFDIPASWPKWKQNAALDGSMRHTSTPDLDNLIKVVDGLNGVVFHDDSSICNIVATKGYSTEPRLEIIITKAAGYASQTTKREYENV